MSTKDEVAEALEASSAADMRVRACVQAVVYGRERKDPLLYRRLVQERNAAFAKFLQAFMHRSRSKTAAAEHGTVGDQL